MSLTSDRQGRIYVLDQVNDRIVRRAPDGKVERVIPIALNTPEDVAVADDGVVAVLDRHSGAAVTMYDADGARLGELPLVGDGIPDSGEVTGIVVDGDDVYAERGHQELVKVGSTAAQPATSRETLKGRPSRDGLSLLRAAIVDKAEGKVAVSSFVRATGEPRFRRDISLWPIVRRIMLLDTDRTGTVYLAVEAQRPGAQASVVLSCLDADSGDVRGGKLLEANTLPEETLRDFDVLDAGGVVYALRSDAGVEYQRFDCERRQ